ncbi:histidine phosphatase family protein [soil metagenome]
MKQLIILRHAKAERLHPDGDRARRLTERGERDSALAGQTVLEAAGMPDAIVSSDAIRAMQTADIVANTIAFPAEIVEEPAIYGANVDELMLVVRALPGDASTIVLVGHNPGFLELINWFAGEDGQREHLPTAAFAIVSGAVQEWAELDVATTSVSPVVSP